METFSCGILTISDKGARGEREDTSGPNLQALLTAHHFTPAAYAIVPDQEEQIQATLKEWADQRRLDLIVTTGGTGVAPSDRTPEATLAVIERLVPGLAEAMRWKSFALTPHAALSRGVAGIRGQSLIINLPGSKKAAQENLEVILPALPHAVAKIKGCRADCGG